MKTLIRPETPADIAAIRQLTQAAFADHPHSEQREHLIIDALRAAGALTLSLVAEMDGVVRGHVALSPVTVSDGSSGWLALGPIAVEPGWQGKGLGSALMQAALDQLRASGAQGCTLVGEPAFYERFGFRHDPALYMANFPAEYARYFQVLRFTPNQTAGEVRHHAAFGLD